MNISAAPQFVAAPTASNKHFVATGAQLSVPGPCDSNDDCIGMRLERDEHRSYHMIAVAIADGVSQCAGGRHAAEICVQGFLSDLFATPETWPIKRAGTKVLEALNRWLYGLAPTGARDRDKHMSTFSGLVIGEGVAHLFHIGDTRIWRWRDQQLTQLTRDDRSDEHRQLGGYGALENAMGYAARINIHYGVTEAKDGDVYLLTTDGVHDWLSAKVIASILQQDVPHEEKVKAIVAQASHTSPDNMSVQLIALSAQKDAPSKAKTKRVPFGLRTGIKLDDYCIESRIYESNRSELFTAVDNKTQQRVVIKVPSLLREDDADHLEHFIREQWLLKQIRSPHIVSTLAESSSEWIYAVLKPIEGITLREWMLQNRRLDLAAIIAIISQIAQALQHLHRLAILHLDIKPENIMIDAKGHVTLIDLGSASHGSSPQTNAHAMHLMTGTTLPYAAPEIIGRNLFSASADMYSLALVAYEMLAGSLPKKPRQTKNGKLQSFESLSELNPYIPTWVDGAVRRACHPEISQRHEALSEFIYELHHPNAAYSTPENAPLIERSPETFWKAISLFEAILLAILMVVWSQS